MSNNNQDLAQKLDNVRDAAADTFGKMSEAATSVMQSAQSTGQAVIDEAAQGAKDLSAAAYRDVAEKARVFGQAAQEASLEVFTWAKEKFVEIVGEMYRLEQDVTTQIMKTAEEAKEGVDKTAEKVDKAVKKAANDNLEKIKKK